jgi:hypothetical protein
MKMRLSRDDNTIRYESALLREIPRERELPRETPAAETLVAMCSFCQNYRFPVQSAVWKELEGLMLERDLPDRFSFTHGICPLCQGNLIDDLT